MGERKAIDNQAVTLMLLLSSVWGMQQVALKAAAPDMAPILQIALRSLIAALAVTAFIVIKRQRWHLEHWRPGILAGLFFSVEYFLIGESLAFTSASHVTVFLYSAPVFVALMLHFTQAAERMTRLQWSGVLLAFSGIAATFLLRDSTQNTTAPNMLWGDFLALLSGFCWACATVTVRNSKLNTVPAAQTLLVQVVTCTVILSTASLMTSQLTFNMTAIVTASLLYQGLIVCSASFLTWFWLLRQYPAAQLGVFAFMTPMFGIIFGMWLLDEPLEQSFLAGSALVMLGITLVTLKPSAIAKLFSRRARKPSEEKCP